MSKTNQAFVPYGIRSDKIFNDSEPDNRARRFLDPQRLVWKSEGEKNSIEGIDNLFEHRPTQITLDTPNPCILSNKGEMASILLDFGVEFHGYVKLYISSVSANPTRLRIRFGESAMEAMAELGGATNATNDHINRDQIINVQALSMPEIGPSGFRFVRIDVIDEGAVVCIKTIKGIFTYRDIEYKGSFYSNDERLNKIWNTGAYTVHLNMQEYVWDGIKRDRLVWIGDMHPESSTIQAVFGYDESVPKSLDLSRDDTPLPKFMNGISSYSIWWILIHYGWYMQNGNKEYLLEQREYMKSLLEIFCGLVSEDRIETLPDFRFIDWPSAANPKAVHAGLQALLRMALSYGAILCKEMSEDDMATKCTAAADKLLLHIPDADGNKQAAAFMALSGLATAAEMNEKVIAIDGAHRLSTFLGYYVLQAQAQADDICGALSNIREYWGAMLDRGATTFWEDFNLDWLENTGRIDELVPAGMKDIHGDFGAYCYIGLRHSLCHGWASGPTAFLSEYVLGVKPIEPGCKTVRIKPNLGDLQWVEGTYPTPLGVIKIKHEKTTSGTVVSSINAPDGIKVVMA